MGQTTKVLHAGIIGLIGVVAFFALTVFPFQYDIVPISIVIAFWFFWGIFEVVLDSATFRRKADVDEDTKETRLQGLKDRLAASDEDDEEVQQLQEEIEELEDRI